MIDALLVVKKAIGDTVSQLLVQFTLLHYLCMLLIIHY